MTIEEIKRPTDKQLFEIAVLFNDGIVDQNKLADMIAMTNFVLDRLLENGDVMIASKKEKEDAANSTEE